MTANSALSKGPWFEPRLEKLILKELPHSQAIQILIGVVNQLIKMQTSRYAAGNRSISGSSSGLNKPPKGFWGKLKRFFQLGLLKTRLLYRKCRSFLWMGTTGFIFVIAPFAFSHFMEINEELKQIARMAQSQKY